MRLQEINELGEKGLSVYMVTHDPLTFSAAKLLLRATTSSLDEPQRNAVDLLQRQCAAYAVLFTEPLV